MQLNVDTKTAYMIIIIKESEAIATQNTKNHVFGAVPRSVSSGRYRILTTVLQTAFSLSKTEANITLWLKCTPPEKKSRPTIDDTVRARLDLY